MPASPATQTALLAALLERNPTSSFSRVQRYLVQCPAVAQAINAIPFKVMLQERPSFWGTPPRHISLNLPRASGDPLSARA